MRDTASSPPSGVVVAFILTGILMGVSLSGCGSQGAYSRQALSDGGADSGSVAGASGTGGETGGGTGGAGGELVGGGTGGDATGGVGGLSGTGGGAVGSGGMLGTGGGAVGSGGVSTAGTGGAIPGTGGTGAIGTGGAGTGGAGTGGAATGGAGGTVGTGGGGGGGAGGQGLGGAASGGMGPRIVSIDFVGGLVPPGSTTVTPAPAMAPTESAGVKPATHWNSAAGIMATLSTLVFSDGAASGATATWNSPANGGNPGTWKNAFADQAGDLRMMNGYLDPSSASTPATVTVSGLPSTVTAGGYDVYVYVMGDIQFSTTRAYKYAIGAANVTVSQVGPSPATFPGYKLVPASGGNYIVFRNLTAPAFTLTATPSSGTPLRAPLNGIQIVSPTGS